jgi:DNA ligase D-like protein (predicted 3'-phosphoesterase)
VIQKHTASHLHYDFRLEIHGVLKSWAVPKGAPTEPGVRRLASATEDYPTEYLDFEGVIPKGQYGGTVMVWDIGSYEIVEGNYWKGNLHISIKGKKLKVSGCSRVIVRKAEPRGYSRNSAQPRSRYQLNRTTSLRLPGERWCRSPRQERQAGTATERPYAA